MLSSLLFLTSLFKIGTLGNFLDTSYGDSLSPLLITGPTSWQVSPIQLNSNHLDYFETIKILFNIVGFESNATDLYAEISLPDDDSATSCSVALLDEDMLDWVAECSYTVEEAGAYGPLRITLRSSQEGQIIAENRAFGYFFVRDAMKDDVDNSLTVTYTDSSTLSISQEVSLTFSFSLSELEWILPGDYFILYVADDFTFEDLKFEFLTSEVEGLENTEIYYDKEDPTQIYIYGIDSEIEGYSGLRLNFTLSGFLNPPYSNIGDEYNWRLRVYRYGTPSVYKFIRGIGPEESIEAGFITVSSWIPKHTALKKYVANGLVTYTVLSFKTQNVFPSDGILTIEVSGAILCEKIYITDSKQVAEDEGECSLKVAFGSKYMECLVIDSTTSSKVECITSESIPAYTSFTMTALTTFKSTSISVTSLTTKAADDSVIDYLFESYSPTLTTASVLTVNQLYITTASNDVSGVFELASSGAHGVVLAFNAPAALVASDTFTLYMPVSTASSRTSQYVALTSTYYSKYVIGSGISFSSSTSLSSAVVATSNKVVVSSGSIRFTLETSASSGNGIVYYTGAGSNDSPNDIYLPLTVSTLTDYSESALVLEKSGSVYIYAQPFYVSANTNDLTLSLIPFCGNVFQPNLPLKVSVSLPYDYNIGSLLVSIYFDDDLTSGNSLSEGDFYPSENLKTDLISNGGLRFNLTKLVKDSDNWFVIAYPYEMEGLSATVSITLIKNSEEIEVFSNSASISSGTEILYMANSDADINVQETKGISFIVDPDDHDGTSLTSHTVRYAYGLPRGFSLEKGSMTLLGHDSQFYESRAAYGTTTISESSTATFSSQITAPWYAVEGLQTVIFAVAIGTDFSDDDCLYSIKQSYTVSSSLAMELKSFSPTSQKAYTYGKIYTYLNLKLTLPGFISPSSYIQFELGDDWKDLYISDEFTSLTLSGTKYSGEYSDSTWISETIETKITGTLELSVLVKLPEVTKDEVSTFDQYIGFNNVMVYYDGLLDSTPAIFQWVQVTHDTDSKTKTKFSAGSTISVNSEAEVYAFPDVVGTTSAFLSVIFTVNQDIPESSIILIDANLETDRSVSSNTWCSFGFQSVSISNGILTLVTDGLIEADSEIRILKESAFSFTQAGFWQVKVTVTVDDHNVIDDSDIPDDSQGFTVSTAPYVKLSQFSMIPGVTNAGTDSWYTIIATLNETLPYNTFIHLHLNKEFNSVSGPSYTFEDLPTQNFVEAQFTDGSFLVCENFNWIISCELGEIESLSLYFRIKLNTPASTGYSYVYFTNETGDVTVKPYYQSNSDWYSYNTTYQNCVDVFYAYANMNEENNGFTHDVLLYFASDLELQVNSVFVVDFPEPYDLDMTSVSNTKCQIIYQNSSTLEETVIYSSSPCSIDGNSVLLPAGLDSFSLSWLNWTIISIQGILTPSIGFSRSPFIYDLSTSDYSTRNFRIALASMKSQSSLTQLTINYVSFDNIQSAFAEFASNSLERIQINSGQTLTVAAGTYSGLFQLSTESKKMNSKKIIITGVPRDSSIQLSNDGTYTLTSSEPSTSFWIGVASGTATGFYYIDWTIEETAYGDLLYLSAPPSLVEIDSSLKYQLDLDYSIIVPPGFYSMPYPISIQSSKLSVSPFEYIELSFYHELNFSISFYPTSVKISSEETFKTFQIYCDGCETGSVYLFKAEVSGPDSQTFELGTELEFRFDYPYEQVATVQAAVNEVTSSSFEIELYSDSMALVTWCLIGEDFYDDLYVSEDYLINNVYSYGFGGGSYGSFESQMTNHSDYLFELLESAESYAEFRDLAVMYSRSLYFNGQDVILESETKTIASFDQLTPNTKYYFYAYVDNYSGYTSVSIELEVTTEQIPSHAYVALEDFISTSDIESTMSELLHIDSKRILTSGFNGRRLQVSQSFVVLASVTESQSGYDLLNTYSQDELGTALGTKITGLSEMSPEDYDDGAWADEPGWEWDSDSRLLSINFSSTADGYLYCEIEANVTGNYSELTSEQVFVKLDRDNLPNEDNWHSLQIDAYSNSSHTFNMTDYELGDYVTSCIVCNDYPLSPSCSDVQNFTFSIEEDSNSFSCLLLGFISYTLI